MPWQLTHGCFNMKIKSELVIIIAVYHISINNEEHALYISDGVVDDLLSSETLVSINNNIDFEYKDLNKDDIFQIFSLIQELINKEQVRILQVTDSDSECQFYN